MPMPRPHKIGNRYYLQRRVPQDLLGEYPGKMIKRALNTSDLQEAKSKLILALAGLEREFALKRKALSGAFDEIDRERAEHLAAEWLRELLQDDWQWRTGAPHRTAGRRWSWEPTKPLPACVRRWLPVTKALFKLISSQFYYSMGCQ